MGCAGAGGMEIHREEQRMCQAQDCNSSNQSNKSCRVHLSLFPSYPGIEECQGNIFLQLSQFSSPGLAFFQTPNSLLMALVIWEGLRQFFSLKLSHSELPGPVQPCLVPNWRQLSPNWAVQQPPIHPSIHPSPPGLLHSPSAALNPWISTALWKHLVFFFPLEHIFPIKRAGSFSWCCSWLSRGSRDVVQFFPGYWSLHNFDFHSWCLCLKRRQQQGCLLFFATCIKQKKNLYSDYFKANSTEQASVKGVNIQIILGGIFFLWCWLAKKISSPVLKCQLISNWRV